MNHNTFNDKRDRIMQNADEATRALDTKMAENHKKSLEKAQKDAEKQEKIKKATKAVGAVAMSTAVAFGAYKGIDSVRNGEDPSRFENDTVAAETIDIADGAIIRENPVVKTGRNDGNSNELTRTDFGDLGAAGETLTIEPDANVYRVDSRTDGDFIGVHVEDLAEALPEDKASALEKDKDGIVWINEQRASVEDGE